MTEAAIVLEIGQVPWGELTPMEQELIMLKYTDEQVGLAAMKVFDLLRKKYQPNYKMGKMYEELSAKYEYYNRVYLGYCQSVHAGRLAHSDFDKALLLNGDKFRAD